MKRPSHVRPPAYLSKSAPVPAPGAVATGGPAGEAGKLDPTRYGDWEKKGLAVERDIDMPIVGAVNDLLEGRVAIDELLETMLSRPPGDEED